MAEAAIQIQTASEAGSHTAEVARTPEAVEAIRPLWRSLQWHYNADIDFCLTLMRSRATIVRPHVVIVSRDDRPVALLAGRIEEGPLKCTLGYRTVCAPTAQMLVIPTGGVMGDGSADVARAMLGAVGGALSRREADLALLARLDTDLELSRQAARRGAVEPSTPHRRLRVDGSYEAFLASCSRNSRENARRCRRRLVRKYGDDLEVTCLRGEDRLEQVSRMLGEIVPKTYQAGMGVGFMTSPEERDLVALAARRGWLRVYVLTIADRPVAFWPGYHYGRTFFSAIPGYDPAHKADRIGTFLLLKLIEDLCADDGVDALDFGFGDAQYKRSFSNEHWQESDIRIFAPTLRGARLRVTRSAVGAVERSARWCLSRAGMHQRVKAAWRRRLGDG